MGKYLVMKSGSAGVFVTLSAALLMGCATTGERYASNVYTADKVNTRQEVKAVKIIAVLPAKVEVDNTQAKQNAQIIGGVLGALAGGLAGHNLDGGRGTFSGGAIGGGVGVAAGSLVSDKTLVDGVSITYTEGAKTYNSAQVGQLCQFSPGTAVMVTSEMKETRIQPNATCPVKKEKKYD